LFQILLPVGLIIILACTSVGLLITFNWRIQIALLAMQYLGASLLVLSNWPWKLAATILVSGWIASAVLASGMTSLGIEKPSSSQTFSKTSRTNSRPNDRKLIIRIIYLLTAALGGLIILSRIYSIIDWMPELQFYQALGGIILITMGLILIGFNRQPFPVCVGLLTILTGFEILLANLESDPISVGLLAAINLGVSLVCANYLLTPVEEVTR